MLTLNNAAVGLVTRRALRRMLAGGELDDSSLALIERLLAKTRPRSHCGWVFVLAEVLGAPREVALDTASLVELCTAAIDLVDDVEDGDAQAYLADAPTSVLINLSAHMFVLVGLFAARLERRLQHSGRGALTGEVLRLFSAMAGGQRLELTREQWSPAAYERMSVLTGGRQFELYLRCAAWAAASEVRPLLALCEPMGVLVQMVFDARTHDQRLLGLPRADMLALRQRHLEELAAALAGVPPAAQAVLAELAALARSEVGL